MKFFLNHYIVQKQNCILLAILRHYFKMRFLQKMGINKFCEFKNIKIWEIYVQNKLFLYLDIFLVLTNVFICFKSVNLTQYKNTNVLNFCLKFKLSFLLFFYIFYHYISFQGSISDFCKHFIFKTCQ